jgi:hypothetical protein
MKTTLQTVIILSCIISINVILRGQDIKDKNRSKHLFEVAGQIQTLRMTNSNVVKSGSGANLLDKNRTVSPGVCLRYTYGIADRHHLQLYFGLFVDLSTDEGFVLNPPLVYQDRSFSGFQSFGTSVGYASSIQLNYQYHILKTQKHTISVAVGPGFLLWKPDFNQTLSYNFIDPADQSFEQVSYGVIVVKDLGSKLFLGGNVGYLQQWWPKVGIKAQVDFQHFFNPIYEVNYFELRTSEANTSQFSYQKRAWGLAYSLGVQFKI